MVASGLACLAAAVLMGVAAQDQEVWLDDAVPSSAGRLVSPDSLLVRVLSRESGWPHGAYVTALLPVVFAMVVVAGEVRRRGIGPVFERWRWVLLTLAAIPFHYGLRVGLARPGPENPGDQTVVVGAYPSGAALAVGLGWVLCVVVVGADRPRWRGWLAAAAVVALVLHAIVRALTEKHWASDILGSYLLVAAAFLLAGWFRRG